MSAIQSGSERFNRSRSTTKKHTAADLLAHPIRRGIARFAAKRGDDQSAREALTQSRQATADLTRATDDDQIRRRGLSAIDEVNDYDTAQLRQRGLAAVEELERTRRGEQL
jgi:hypothetical protein